MSRENLGPTQPEMGSPALERVPQGISLCLLGWSSQSPSCCLTSISPASVGSLYLQLPTTSPAAWPGCLRSLRRKRSQISLQGLEGPWAGDPIPTISSQISEGKEWLNPCPCASPPSGTAHGFPAQYLLPGAAPSMLITPQVPTPRASRSCLRDKKLPRKPEVLQWGLYRSPRSLISTLSPAPQGPHRRRAVFWSALVSAAHSWGWGSGRMCWRTPTTPHPTRLKVSRQRLLPFIQSPTVPGSPYQPTSSRFSPIL